MLIGANTRNPIASNLSYSFFLIISLSLTLPVSLLHAQYDSYRISQCSCLPIPFPSAFLSTNIHTITFIHSFIHSKHFHLRNSQSHNPSILTAMVQNGFYTQTTSDFLPQTSFHWDFDLRFHSLDCSVSISLNLQLD